MQNDDTDTQPPARLQENATRESSIKTLTQQSYGFISLLLISALVYAGTNGLIKLPDTYRTPLSDMAVEDHKQWRVKPEEDNPWREQQDELIIQPRLKTEFFPEYDYNTVDDPTTRSLFQNEFELERPRTNIFKYTF